MIKFMSPHNASNWFFCFEFAFFFLIGCVILALPNNSATRINVRTKDGAIFFFFCDQKRIRFIRLTHYPVYEIGELDKSTFPTRTIQYQELMSCLREFDPVFPFRYIDCVSGSRDKKQPLTRVPVRATRNAKMVEA